MHHDAALAPGAVFEGRYEIVDKLGEGGFGTVHKARQLSTGQLVALKILRTADPGAAPHHSSRVARFLREARVCAQLRHPNIVQLVDAGQTAEGALYIAFVFVPGDNLATVLETEGALSPREARHLMLQVLDALTCAHAEGVIHRDLKPSNIMVSPTGARRNALVLDFGIGAMIGGDRSRSTRLTGSQDTLGTPGYGAPEQWRSVDPTARADLFSWGLVFLECLIGAPVYTGTAAEIFYRLLAPEPVPMPAALERHPLGELIGRAVRKDAALREVTARGLLEALDACDLRGLSRDALLGVRGGTTSSGATPYVAPSRAALPAPSPAERRHVTALSCRVRVRGEVTAPVDVDALDARLRAALAMCVDAARNHGGHCVAVLGDDLMIYFGHMVAADDDPHRAARAAHAILAAVGAANARVPDAGVEVSLGIHGGTVVDGAVADLDGAGLVSGTTPRRAVQLAAIAPAGMVIVSAVIEPLLRARFELEPAGSLPVGPPGPIAGVDATGEGPRDSLSLVDGSLPLFRLGPEHETATLTLEGAGTPIVGRDSELALLLERWQRTREGSGQCSLITGEPGIGKSRLARELRHRIADAARFLELRCAPDTLNSALAPVVELLERALGLDRASGTGTAAGRLESELVRLGLVAADTMPLFASLLALPLEAPHRPLDVSPQRHKALTLEAIVSLLLAIAERSPVLLLAEDLHWADPTTIELLTRLVREAPGGPICIVMTARPEFSPSFSSAGVLMLPLGRLGRAHIEQMVGALGHDRRVPPSVIDHITDRADGVPLFIEELLRMMVDTGVVVERGDRWELGGQLSSAVIPRTLRALLTARLDRLPHAKHTAQLAAALGREFSLDVLSAVSPRGAAAVADDLEQLMHAGLVLRKLRSKDAVAMFKHALVRDAAYESLPLDARRSAHARIAETLEDRFRDVVRTRPDLLAHHHAAADRKSRAVVYAQRAAEHSLQRSAFGEAIAHASSAISWTQALEGGDAVEAELAANGALIQAVMATRGWADPRVKAVADRSAALLEQLAPDSKHRVPTLWSLFTYHHVASHRLAARAVAEQLVAISEGLGDTGFAAAAAMLHGLALFIDGDHAAARPVVERAAALYDPARDRDHGARFGLDSLVLANAFRAHLRWFAGDATGAFELVARAIAWARELEHVPSIALGLLYGCTIHQRAGDRDAVAAMAGQILGLSAKYGLPAYEGYAATLHAWATGDDRRATAIVGGLADRGCKLALSYYGSLVADNQAARGELDAALSCIDHCLSLCRDNDEHFYEPELHRRRALYEAQRDPTADSVRTSLEHAARLAQRQDMPRVEAMATLDLLRWFGTAERRARLDELLTLHPGLRELGPDHHEGEARCRWIS